MTIILCCTRNTTGDNMAEVLKIDVKKNPVQANVLEKTIARGKDAPKAIFFLAIIASEKNQETDKNEEKKNEPKKPATESNKFFDLNGRPTEAFYARLRDNNAHSC